MIAVDGSAPLAVSRRLHQPRLLAWNPGWIVVGTALALSLLGISAIAVTRPDLALRHGQLLAVGLLAGAAIALPNYRWLRLAAPPALAVVLLLLVFLLIPWVPESIVHPRNGARRWINLQVTDIQPSELAKIAYVLVLAGWLRYRRNQRTARGLVLPVVLTILPMGLILVEPDLGTAMLFLPTLLAMLIAAGGRGRHLVIAVLLGILSAGAMYPVLAPHQKARLRALVAQVQGDDRYDLDIGFQGARAMTLVGAGGVTGVGDERATQLVRWNRLPEGHNDMVFAVIVVRWGAMGGAATWGAFALLGAGGLVVAARCRDSFGRLVAVGLTTMLLSQMTVNTGMAIGVAPITGMTLPFVSYGGSSLVSAWLMVGIITSIAVRRPRRLWRAFHGHASISVEGRPS